MSLMLQEKGVSVFYAQFNLFKIIAGTILLLGLLMWFFSIPDADVPHRSPKGHHTPGHKSVNYKP